MSGVDQDAAKRGVSTVLEAVGVKNVSPEELEVIAAAVVGVVQVLGDAATKRATAAGQAAADKITDEETAETAASERK